MAAMAAVAKKTILDEDDRISRLPDAVLGDIISLLPTRDGARTQVISSRWRHLWLSAPLNLDLRSIPIMRRIPVDQISRILSEHPGPGRRFSFAADSYFQLPESAATTLDGWFLSPALDKLQELEFNVGFPLQGNPPTPLPASACRFSCTLRVASFAGCGFPDVNNACALQLPLLKQLSLMDVSISESSLNAMLAACPVLQSLLLLNNSGCPRVRIVSNTLRSIGVRSSCNENLQLQKLIIEDAPCLERLLFLRGRGVDISVTSAPKLDILGRLYDDYPRITLDNTLIQGSRIVSFSVVTRSVKILALEATNLNLDVVINFMKCFPCLEKLYIETVRPGEKNVWRRKYRNLIGTLDIRLKEIVLTYYRGNDSHVNFAKFFILNARALELMRLELKVRNPSSAWIERQHSLLQIKEKVSDAQFDFVAYNHLNRSLSLDKQTHDLSTADPFARSCDRN